MKEFTKKSPKELSSLLAEKRLGLRTFRFSVAGSNTRNVKEGKAFKKDIARILTLLNKKEGGEALPRLAASAMPEKKAGEKKAKKTVIMKPKAKGKAPRAINKKA